MSTPNPVLKYFFNEAKNRILVSSSAAVNTDINAMNALLTSSKTTFFDSNFTSQLTTIGTSISYTVLNGADDNFVIPFRVGSRIMDI